MSTESKADPVLESYIAELPAGVVAEISSLGPNTRAAVQNMALINAHRVYDETGRGAAGIVFATMQVVMKQIMDCKTIEEVHGLFSCYQRERTEKEPPREPKE